MSASQLPLPLAPRHHNAQLFAHRYLDEMLPRQGAWLDLAGEAAPALALARARLAALPAAPGAAEAERELLRPLLAALGHRVAAPALSLGLAAYLRCGEASGPALAVGCLAAWGALGQGDARDAALAEQIALAMGQSGAPWGFLTDGRRWRLYRHEPAGPLGRFYEVDLQELAEANSPQAFLAFYAFFRRAAFEPAGGAALTLDGMLGESADYARGLAESLAAQAEQALRHIAQGFLGYPRNRLADAGAPPLDAIAAASVVVICRLLFVLYAEARELLPLRESPAYRDKYSLSGLAREVGRRIDSGLSLLLDTGHGWERLRELFALIYRGSPALGLAAFRGGLFAPQGRGFLGRYAVGDAQLQLAIDKLARVASPQTGLREFVDYRDLSEEQLGAIYARLRGCRLGHAAQGADGLTVDLLPGGRGAGAADLAGLWPAAEVAGRQLSFLDQAPGDDGGPPEEGDLAGGAAAGQLSLLDDAALGEPAPQDG